jgi:hypothetical protein
MVWVDGAIMQFSGYVFAVLLLAMLRNHSPYKITRIIAIFDGLHRALVIIGFPVLAGSFVR